MITIEKIDIKNKNQVRRFIEFPFQLYKDCPQWVPPFRSDLRTVFDHQKHPFYEHSEAEFFTALRDGEVVAQIAAMINHPFNRYHNTRQAQFTLFDCKNDPEAVGQLFSRVYEWVKEKGMDCIDGPKGFSSFDGYGMLVEGFENRQMMTMSSYNHSYYPTLIEQNGFQKEVDFVSCHLDDQNFVLPEKVKEVARRVRERGSLKIKKFSSKTEIKQWAKKLIDAYNKAFVNNWEYYPLTDRELQYLIDSLLTLVDPKLITFITHNDDVVGFLLAFPDVSAALQRMDGKITPWGIWDVYRETKRTKWVSFNGAGILPEFIGRGGNALMYDAIVNTIHDFGFKNIEMSQVAETAVQMRKDLATLGGIPYKNHRVYKRCI